MTQEEEFEVEKLFYRLEHDILTARDMLQPIIDGEVQRGHCSPGSRECYGGVPGKRKLTLKDAVQITKHVVTLLNRAATRRLDEERGR